MKITHVRTGLVAHAVLRTSSNTKSELNIYVCS